VARSGDVTWSAAAHPEDAKELDAKCQEKDGDGDEGQSLGVRIARSGLGQLVEDVHRRNE